MTTAPTPTPVLRDPREAWRRLQAGTRDFLQEVDRVAFQGHGDADFWMNRAEYMAFRAAVFAATSTLAVQEQREDPPDLRAANAARVARADGDLQRLADHWATGHGDVNYWFGRCKALGHESAVHAARVASMCDAPMAAALGPALKQGLQAADDAFRGHGDAHYWSARTARAAGDLKASLGSLGPALQAAAIAPGPAGPAPSPFQADLERLDEGFGREVGGLIFGRSGDVSDWLFRTQHVATRATAYAARKAMLVGAQRVASLPERDAATAEVAADLKGFAGEADRLATGSGDADFWCKRAVLLAHTATRHANDVASRCDAPMLRGARPLLEDLLQRAEGAGFGGSGYAEYWMNRVVDGGADLKLAFQGVAVAARAEVEAEKVAPPPGESWTPERAGLEAAVARNRALRDGWEALLVPLQAPLAPYRMELDALDSRIGPLRERDAKVLKWQGPAALAALAGGLAGLAGALASALPGPVRLGLLAGGGAVLAGGLLAKGRLQKEHEDLAGQYRPLERRRQGVTSEVARLERGVRYARPHHEAAVRDLSAAESRLLVLRMAAGADRSGDVKVDDDTVDIGGIKVPRRRAASAGQGARPPSAALRFYTRGIPSTAGSPQLRNTSSSSPSGRRP